MVMISAYLRLIRLPILVMIALIQYGMRHGILEPMLKINGYQLMMTDLEFGYLVLATVLIAAGGYAINDYFDVKTDRINKPKKVIVDLIIKRRIAMVSHVALTGIGLALAGYLSWALGVWKMTSLFLFAAFLLWYYSTYLKSQLIIGNITIALLAGSVPLIVGLYEIPLLNEAHPESIEQLGYSIFNVPAYWITGFSILLFWLTVTREITKDVCDIRGDKAFDRRTIPIAWGIRISKSIIMSLYIIFGAGLTWLYFEADLQVHYGMTSMFFILSLLLILQLILIFRAKTKKHFSYSADLNGMMVFLLAASTFLIRVSIENYFL